MLEALEALMKAQDNQVNDILGSMSKDEAEVLITGMNKVRYYGVDAPLEDDK